MLVRTQNNIPSVVVACVKGQIWEVLRKPADEIGDLECARLFCSLSSQSQLAVLDVDMKGIWKVLFKFSYTLLKRTRRESEVRLHILPDMIVLNAPSEQWESEYSQVSTCLVYELNVVVLAEFPPSCVLEQAEPCRMPRLRTRHRSPLEEVSHISSDILPLP